MSEQFGYGMGFYKTVSDDLKSILPEDVYKRQFQDGAGGLRDPDAGMR